MTVQHRIPPPTRKLRTVGNLVRDGGRLLRGLLAFAVLLALVAGLPWALTRYVGWPLPQHMPTWDDVQATLLNPMSPQLLLNVLACLCWIVWFFFILDVLRCTVDALHGITWPQVRPAGPLHGLAAALIGTVVLTMLGNRAPTSPPTTSLVLTSNLNTVAVTAPAHSGPAHLAPAMSETTLTIDRAAPAPPGMVQVTEMVRLPQDGIYDTLWRVAERIYGDGTRWPELFQLNRGVKQPDGRALTHPNLVRPGWKITAYILTSAAPVEQPTDDQQQPVPPQQPSHTTVPTTLPSPQPAPSTTQAPPATGTNSHPSAAREPGFSWGSELFVGLGLAAAVSAALLVTRRRYRSGYRPGSGDRDDLPMAPVVYQLRLAHLRAEQDDETGLDEVHDDGEHPERLAPPPALVVGAPEIPSGNPPALTPGLGVRDGREIALDFAVARGLGLIGAGAPAAARALLVAALTASLNHLAVMSDRTGAIVLVPADDLMGLLGRGVVHAQLPAALRVVTGLDDALDALEAETLVRVTSNREQNAAPESWPPLVLVARPPEHHHRQRLQAVLDNGAPFGITGLLLGQWQPGVTAYVREDGTVSATSPGLGEALRGMRMFRLCGEDTAELLTLLHQAEPDASIHDGVLAPPMPQPENVSEQPARHRYPADTELEIVGTHVVPAPGTRLRPSPRDPKPVPPSSATISIPPTTTTTTTAEDQADGEVTAAPPTAHPTDPSVPAAVPIRITVLGSPRVFWRPEPDSPGSPGSEATEREITGVFQPRTRELLVFLALHPGGASREALMTALWWDNLPEKTTNAMNTALSRLRRSLSKATDGALSDIMMVGDGRYRLDPAVVDVDYWRFEAAMATRRATTTEQQRIDAYREIIDSYGGPLADGISTEWIETAREAIRRDAIDAVAALARALVEDDPQQTLDLLEMARAFDPHNEALYRDIMRLQERLGQLDAIPRTLALLTTRLAEIDTRPTDQAVGLATRLCQRHDDNPAQPRSATRGQRDRSAAS